MPRPCKNPVCLESLPDLEETIGVIEQAREERRPVPAFVELHAFGYCSAECEHAEINRQQIALLRREARQRK